jgi:hypothetical protein
MMISLCLVINVDGIIIKLSGLSIKLNIRLAYMSSGCQDHNDTILVIGNGLQ